MKESLIKKLDRLSERMQELDALLADPVTINDQKKFRELSREHADLRQVVTCYKNYRNTLANIASAREMLKDPDISLRELAVEELKLSSNHTETLEKELQALLLPKDPADDSNLFLEIRAGTGGQEAA